MLALMLDDLWCLLVVNETLRVQLSFLADVDEMFHEQSDAKAENPSKYPVLEALETTG